MIQVEPFVLNKIDEKFFPDISLMETITEDLFKQFVKNKDEVIKKAIIKYDIDPEDIEYLKENLQLINIHNDEFEHLYFRWGKSDEVRIISIDKKPSIDYTATKMTVLCRYY